jgi:hypothetical protein
MFTFGTLDGEIEGFQEAAAKGKEENQRITDMEDSIGAETFEMINEQLAGMNRASIVYCTPPPPPPFSLTLPPHPNT